MIHIRASIDRKHFVAEREYKAAMTRANAVAGQMWHSRMLPEHFKKDAQKKYNYKARSTKYREWKKKKWATRRPMRNGQYIEGSGDTDNVLSGDMRDLLTRSSIVRAYPTRATVNMTGPRYITMRVFNGDAGRAISEGWTYGKGKKFNRSRIGTQPDKIAEVTATTFQEREELARAQDHSLEKSAAGWHGD